jgi:hypothetical protein
MAHARALQADVQGSKRLAEVLTVGADGRHLLVTVRLVGLASGPPSASTPRLLLIDTAFADGQQQAPPVELLRLPAEILHCSYNWAPHGNWVAFVTRESNGPGATQFVALCGLEISAAGDVSGFRYVADMAPRFPR